MNLVEELSAAEHIPLEAMRAATRTPDRVAAGVLRVVEKAGSGAVLAPRETNLLFWGIHVLAQVRDTRLFRPLLAMLRLSSDDLDKLLGDAVTGTLSRVLASTFDGDVNALTGAILDPATEEYAGWALFNALTTLTIAGGIGRPRAHDLARRFDDERPAPPAEAGWIGWAETVAVLGFHDLAPRVRDAFATGRLLEDAVDGPWFEDTLAAAIESSDALDALDRFQFGFIRDAATELDDMLATAAPDEVEPLAPILNPLRHVGRNDSCPCGSGRKFKACCLGKAEMPPSGAALAGSGSPAGVLPPFMPRLPPLRGR